MKKNILTIEIDGVHYPCRETMGAMVHFQNEFGKKLSKITDISDWCAYLFCCVRSASISDKIDFPFDFESFADNVDAEIVLQWVEFYLNKMQQASPDNSKKK